MTHVTTQIRKSGLLIRHSSGNCVTCMSRFLTAEAIITARTATGSAVNSWLAANTTMKMKAAMTTLLSVDLAPVLLRIMVLGGAVQVTMQLFLNRDRVNIIRQQCIDSLVWWTKEASLKEGKVGAEKKLVVTIN